jgi:hypothetical protein
MELCRKNPLSCDTGGQHSEMKREPHRKRFVGILAAIAGFGFGLAGFGVSMTNSYHLSHLTSKVAALTEAMSGVEQYQHQNSLAIKNLIASQEKIYSFLHHNVEEISDMIKMLECKEDEAIRQVNMKLLSHMYAENVRRVVRAVIESSITGRVTTDLISMESLRELFRRESSFDKSLITQEPSLIYQFAKVYPLKFDFENLRFAMILAVPIPEKRHVRTLFTVANVGYNSPNHKLKLKLDLPSLVVTDTHPNDYVGILEEHCEVRPGLWLCPEHAIENNRKSKCLGALIMDSEVRKNSEFFQRCLANQLAAGLTNDTDILSTLSGVLIRHPPKRSLSPIIPILATKLRGKRFSSPNQECFTVRTAITHI